MTDVFKLLEQAEAAKKLATILGVTPSPEFILNAMQGIIDLSPKDLEPSPETLEPSPETPEPCTTSPASHIYPDKLIHPS